MGWVVDIVFDWLFVGVFDRIARRFPPWAVALLLILPIMALLAVLWLFVR